MARSTVGQTILVGSVTFVAMTVVLTVVGPVVIVLLGITALLAGCVLVVAVRALLAVLKKRRIASAVATPLVVLVTVFASILASGWVTALRMDGAKDDCGAIVEQLEEERRETGVYPLQLDDMSRLPELPAFAAPPFYEVDADRRRFRLRLTFPAALTHGWVYDSHTSEWTYWD